MQNVSETYLCLLRESEAQCRALLEAEQAKRRALLGNDKAALADVMQRQQADMMQLESLERQRVKEQTALGFSAQATAEEIAAQLPSGAAKEEFARLCIELRESAAKLRELNAYSLELAREELHFMEQMQGGQQAGPETGVYSPGKRSASPSTAPTFEEKI